MDIAGLGAMLTILALVVSGISVHLLNVLKQLGIATSAALAIGMVIGPSQVVARVAAFSVVGTSIQLGQHELACCCVWSGLDY